jgi:hypothetical protein
MSLKQVADLADLTAQVSNLPEQLAWVTDGRQVWKYAAASMGVHDGVTIIKPTSKLATQPGRWLFQGSVGDNSVGLASLKADVLSALQPGARAINVLRVASDVVSATGVEIGDDVFEIEIVNTDSTDDTDNEDFDSEDSPLVVEDAVLTYPGCTFEVGALIRIENEILRVSAVEGDDVTFLRAQSGTVLAAHADAEDIFIGDGVTAGAIAVGLVATLTPAAFTDALAPDIAEHATEAVSAAKIGDNEVLITADEVGVVELACAENLAGANNAWANATMYGGAEPGPIKLSIQTRVPKAEEIALGNMHFPFDFEPVVLAVLVYVTATPGIAKAWDGSVGVDGNLVTLFDGGAENLEATDTVVLIVTE